MPSCSSSLFITTKAEAKHNARVVAMLLFLHFPKLLL